MYITAFEVGAGKVSVLSKLINKIGENNLKIVCTDGNFSYEEELGINANIKHVISKSETCLVENYNSVLRYYLARLHRSITSQSQVLQQIYTNARALNCFAST